MPKSTFETIALAEALARKTMPASAYLGLLEGQGAGVTMRDNVAAFDMIGIAPRMADMAAERDLSATIMGQRVSMPVVLSPAGSHAVHPDGELAVARAAKAHGIAMGVSSFASRAIEDV